MAQERQTAPAQVAQTIAAVLGVREQRSLPLMETVIEYLRARHVLLVLDNCEHLIAACAEIADQSLRASPGLKIIASSREALGINGEVVYRVPSLSLPPAAQATRAAVAQTEAAQLFFERAVAANPKLSLTEKNAAAVAQICRQLDGIPLALELAAARVTIFSVDQIAARLAAHDSFRLLTGGSRTALPRQQTLRAMIDWSYDLLSDAERILLRQLSVFAGGWTFEAAEAISPDLDVLESLSQLVNKSLVAADDEAGETRYRLGETIRQYVRDKLAQAGETEPTCQRHLRYFIEFAEAAREKLDGLEALDWLPQVEAEFDNFRTGLDWGLDHDVEGALRLVTALFAYWFRHGHMVEGMRWTSEALARADRLPKLEGEAARRQMSVHAKAWLALADLAYFNDNVTALKAAVACQALARQLGDTRMLAASVYIADSVTILSGDPAGALSAVDEMLAAARASGDPHSLGMALSLMSQFCSMVKHDFDAARAYEEEALAVLSVDPTSWEAVNVLFSSARAAMQRGDYRLARARFIESLPLFQRIGDEHRINVIDSELAHIDRYEGRHEQAERAYAKTILIWQKIGHRAAVAHQLESFAIVVKVRAQAERATRLFGAAEALRERISIPMSPQEHVEYDREIASLRAGLEVKTFETLWAEGRAMTMESAIAYALEEAPA